ncbi:type 2 periplasmic-binding domain-containing protein [Shewanella woodyi]|uniref:Type IV pilus assembly protein PilM n=1 Tax=Shewanella woodyi (strain ATCC 51908 / MS32) TaxID=392500 RepID=B1KIV3_SHEWM|nr:type IV pilus assembly protein PilM [Shewanella woodyi ATCC 51908]
MRFMLRLRIKLLLISLLSVFCLTPNAYSETLVTTIPQSWQLNLLKEALSRVETQYDISMLDTEMNQKRKVEEALAGSIDIFWSMTSQQLEAVVLPVRIPIFKGLLGNRLLIIRSDEQQRFIDVKSRDDFLQFYAGQNRYWPDALILEENGLPLITSYKYKNLYPMLEGGRFDYLALGAQEIWQELDKNPDPNLKVDSAILLQYRSPAYFFISPEKPLLAKDLKKGLESMIADGSFDQLFNKELEIDALYEQAQFSKRRIIRLQTPGLSSLTPVTRDELWLDLFNMEGKGDE